MLEPLNDYSGSETSPGKEQGSSNIRSWEDGRVQVNSSVSPELGTVQCLEATQVRVLHGVWRTPVPVDGIMDEAS